MKCEHCGKEHDRKRFCSNKCKDRWHNKQRAFSMLGEQATDIEDMAAGDERQKASRLNLNPPTPPVR